MVKSKKTESNTVSSNVYTMEMDRIIREYNGYRDDDIYDFVEAVKKGEEVSPLTVGFINQDMADRIYELTHVCVSGNRIILSADDVRHIINRHGLEGKADQSLKTSEDISKMSYVLSNYDNITWDGGKSSLYRLRDGSPAPQITISKRIDGVYYVIEVVSDSSKKRNVICSARLTKA